MPGKVSINTQLHITCWTYFKRDMLFSEIGNENRVLNRSYSMPKSLSAQCLNCSPHTIRSNRLTRMWCAMQSCLTGFFKPFCILLRRITNLCSTKSQGNDTIILALQSDCQRIFGTSAIEHPIWNVTHNIKDPPDFYPKLFLRQQTSA